MTKQLFLHLNIRSGALYYNLKLFQYSDSRICLDLLLRNQDLADFKI